MILEGIKLISQLDLIKEARAGHHGLIQTLFRFTSIVPWSDIVVWASWGLRKLNQYCPDAVAPYLKHVALWVLEWSWDLAAMALLSCSNFWLNSLSVSSKDACGAFCKRVSSCIVEIIEYFMILSTNLTIFAAYSVLEQSRLCISEK